jgi:LPXTG-motif cell wall-anchored protein
MNIDRFCDLLPDTGTSFSLTVALAIVLAIAGVGMIIVARRGGARTAAMALMPIALLVPAGTQSDMNTNDQRSDQKQCVERPWDDLDIGIPAPPGPVGPPA